MGILQRNVYALDFSCEKYDTSHQVFGVAEECIGLSRSSCKIIFKQDPMLLIREKEQIQKHQISDKGK
ncbi:hypothetical protein C5167_011299 [Papaver somniferum]|uniref:Uncharacterized protein n=1 Tax=Papaver somniferum TaxID=3469 RepID=A0A4Y7K5J2_PAPSO|nr:hypothetical protein C5167_011299 [Papaver somniferum]